MSSKPILKVTGLQCSAWMSGLMPARIAVLPVLLFFVFSLTSGCDRSAPEDLIDEEKYVNLLTEMHLLAAMKELTDDDEKFREGQKTVLDHYGITRDQFERSHNYYFQDVKAQQQRMRNVRRNLEEMSSDLSDYEQKMRRKREEEVADTMDVEE